MVPMFGVAVAPNLSGVEYLVDCAVLMVGCVVVMVVARATPRSTRGYFCLVAVVVVVVVCWSVELFRAKLSRATVWGVLLAQIFPHRHGMGKVNRGKFDALPVVARISCSFGTEVAFYHSEE